MIKFLCYSDLHGAPPILPDPARYDAIILAGDTLPDAVVEYTWLSSDAAHALHRNMSNTIAEMSRTKAIYSVRGNHDNDDVCNTLKTHTKEIGQRVIQVDDKTWLAGLEWYGKKYWHLPGDYELAPLCKALAIEVRNKVPRGDDLILVTHYAPPSKTLSDYGLLHYSNETLLECIESLRPIAVVYGHIHEIAGEIEPLDFGDPERFTQGHTILYSAGCNGVILDTTRLIVRSSHE